MQASLRNTTTYQYHYQSGPSIYGHQASFAGGAQTPQQLDEQCVQFQATPNVIHQHQQHPQPHHHHHHHQLNHQHHLQVQPQVHNDEQAHFQDHSLAMVHQPVQQTNHYEEDADENRYRFGGVQQHQLADTHHQHPQAIQYHFDAHGAQSGAILQPVEQQVFYEQQQQQQQVFCYAPHDERVALQSCNEDKQAQQLTSDHQHQAYEIYEGQPVVLAAQSHNANPAPSEPDEQQQVFYEDLLYSQTHRYNHQNIDQPQSGSRSELNTPAYHVETRAASSGLPIGASPLVELGDQDGAAGQSAELADERDKQLLVVEFADSQPPMQQMAEGDKAAYHLLETRHQVALGVQEQQQLQQEQSPLQTHAAAPTYASQFYHQHQHQHHDLHQHAFSLARDLSHTCNQSSNASNNSSLNATATYTTNSSAASNFSSESGDSDLSESLDSTLSRDEKKAREANIPLSYYEIVNLSIDQFNEHVAKFNFSEAQLTLMKDIRRRGKNKVAAQTCRKRKMEQISELDHEVRHLVEKKRLLGIERNNLKAEHDRLLRRYEQINSLIRKCLNKETPII